ncbi:hypothetical protein VNO77_23655 [Canavalia gladiata]|uniref:Uncharacterized protein n=1 Tax=Canavalia gladiata TaxID=3824 RepID=A0AAN9L646_CANGL
MPKQSQDNVGCGNIFWKCGNATKLYEVLWKCRNYTLVLGLSIRLLDQCMAPPQADLRKIGAEGFALIDKFYGPSRRSNANDAFQGRRERSWVVYHLPNDFMEQPSVNFNSNDAAFHYAGISVVNYSKGKPQNRWNSPFQI